MLTDQKNNLDIVSIIESAGIELKKQGQRHVSLCPFHAEKTPSFYVFQDQRFKCFGCGEHGDVIDFVQKQYGLSFLDALKHLGIEYGELSVEAKAGIQRRKRERREKQGFKEWEQAASAELHLLISSTKKVLKTIQTLSDFEQIGSLFHSLTFWESCLQVLIHGDKKEKRRLYMDCVVTGEYQEERLWNDDFNYLKWLEKFNQKRDADEWTINLHFAGRETSCAETLASG